MRLIEEITTPSAAAVAAVQAARASDLQQLIKQPPPESQSTGSGGVDDPAWNAATAEIPEPVGLTPTERHQMDTMRDKYGKHQRERDGSDAVHVSPHTHPESPGWGPKRIFFYSQLCTRKVDPPSQRGKHVSLLITTY
jgi:hypothetical protein